MTIAAGKLSDRVTLQAESRTPNGQGGFDTGWTDVATIWAEVFPLSGDEAIIAQIERAVARFRVTIRKRADVTAKNRLMWKGQVLAIKAVLPHPSALDDALLLTCEAGAGS